MVCSANCVFHLPYNNLFQQFLFDLYLKKALEEMNHLPVSSVSLRVTLISSITIFFYPNHDQVIGFLTACNPSDVVLLLFRFKEETYTFLIIELHFLINNINCNFPSRFAAAICTDFFQNGFFNNIMTSKTRLTISTYPTPPLLNLKNM